MSTIKHHLEAEIYYLTTEEGGRKNPVFSGYRPQFYYDGHNWDASHRYPNKDCVNLGETVFAELSLMSPNCHKGKLFPGMPFEIREGSRVVGRGKILKVFI